MLYFYSLPDYVQIYRTEIILCPRHNDREDSEKLVWSRLCDDFTIQEYGAISFPIRVTNGGIYHIDAVPRAFNVILNWLRYRKIILGDIRRSEEEDVIPVADSLGLYSKKFDSALWAAV